MEHTYYRIGQVSQVTGISKDTLHFFNKIGLLVPDHIDPNNQYRYYSLTQTSHPVSGAEIAINPAKSRKRFVSAGRPARKSTTSAEISSFRAINPSSSF